jgi:hypothetical protein
MEEFYEFAKRFGKLLETTIGNNTVEIYRPYADRISYRIGGNDFLLLIYTQKEKNVYFVLYDYSTVSLNMSINEANKRIDAIIPLLRNMLQIRIKEHLDNVLSKYRISVNKAENDLLILSQ